MTDLTDRIEQHCRTAFAGTWDTMPEDRKASWRRHYTPAVEAQMKAEEERR